MTEKMVGDSRREQAALAAASFPALEARSLTGRHYALPEDFEGEWNAVLVGFEWWQQAVMDSWMPTLEALAARHPGLRVYEVVPIPAPTCLRAPPSTVAWRGASRAGRCGQGR
jgi:hypothetical protein